MTLVHQESTSLVLGPPRYHEGSPRTLVSQTWVQTRRILLRWARDLTTVIEALVLPVLFLLTLNIILGNVISQVTGHSALYGTVPLNALAATINGAAIGAIGLIGERSDGLLRRLWVVPAHRASGALSRLAAEMIRIMITTAVVLGVGMLLGFRFRQGLFASLAWLAVPLIFGLAFTTLITMVALYTANNFLLETVTLVHVLAVVFSTGFLPVDQFPKWIQPVVAHQPMSYAIEAMRGLSLGGPVRWPMIATLLWAGGITVVCIVPTLVGYRRASTS
ncbi:ABC transporter permease [Mycobacterium sp. SMC-2]|nr:ABC transporter permease [Mycobacterium sp. SMC-2]UXA08634.1 ABC transporter permease [Mycobacterium sp. SMC-2]